jgi:multidrug efflux pump subunit AcrA (membrane-fusion protein)
MDDSVLQEIDLLLDGLASLAKELPERKEFYASLLERVVCGIEALGGSIWRWVGPTGLSVEAAAGCCAQSETAGSDAVAWRRACVTWVLNRRTPKVAPPRLVLADDLPLPNPTDWLLLYVPWTVADMAAGVIEIAARPGASPALQEGYLRVLEAVCEIVAEHERRALLDELRQFQRHFAQLDEFARRIHSSLDLRLVAYAMANEGFRILGCDRVSVLVQRRRRCEAVAVSGAESFSRRSNTIRLLERVATAALAAGEPLWYPAERELPPQIEAPLEEYLDESHARALGIVPLCVEDADGLPAERKAERRIVGGLAVERFFGPADERLRATSAALAAHGALAIQNALVLERLPFGRFQRNLVSAAAAFQGRRVAGWGVGVAALAAVAAVLAWTPADFSVEARGELQPVAMRDLFAPDDAVVAEWLIPAGSRVEANQVVLALRKPSLELELKRVWGELQTARKRLAAVESEQLLNRREDEVQRKRYTELTAQQEELRALVASLQSQHEILKLQEAELQVRSPIAGELLTWDAEQLLAARPVTRGQALLTVADLSGPWRLELRIPERRIRHLVEARARGNGRLEVSFALATHPGRVLRAELDRVGERTEVSEFDGAVVLATAALDAEEIPERVPGASVVARIHCGTRSLGYVWLHDLIDAVRTWILF